MSRKLLLLMPGHVLGSLMGLIRVIILLRLQIGLPEIKISNIEESV